MVTKQAKLKEQAYASKLKSRALSVLIYLIDRSNQELTCFPAISTMAEQLHISVSTVKRALRELVDGGYISKDARFREKNQGQSSNLYTLILQQKQNEVENIDTLDTGEDSEPDTDNFFSIKEEQESNFSTTMLQGRVAEHISFKSLKEKEAESEGKETIEVFRSEKDGIVAMECLSKEFNIMPKLKKLSCIHRSLANCTPVHFVGSNFKDCFWRLCALWGERIDKEIRVYSSAYLLFVFNVDGGGGQFESPLNYSG